MEYVYAALMLHATSKEVTEDGISKVLTAAGAKANKARVKALVAALEGIDIDEAISKATFAPVATPTATAVAAPTTTEVQEEKKEEEASKEEEEETGMEGLGALFG
jgi:large subunit ribosomal protein L12